MAGRGLYLDMGCEAFCILHQLEKFPIQMDLRACHSITFFPLLAITV